MRKAVLATGAAFLVLWLAFWSRLIRSAKKESGMNGAESLVATLAASGIEVCFANPGTSEMHFVAALDREPRSARVLCLFEGVATGAADGYGRMAGKPAATLLHLGPGFANGIANLHNAQARGHADRQYRGRSCQLPYALYDAPLTSDIMGICRPVSHWLHSTRQRQDRGRRCRARGAAARAAPGQIATLMLPADTAWDEAEGAAPPLPVAGPAPVSDARDRRVAARLAERQEDAAAAARRRACSATACEAAGRIARQERRAGGAGYFSPPASRAARACRRSSAFPISPKRSSNA